MDLHRIKESECEMCGDATTFQKRTAQTPKNVRKDGFLMILLLLLGICGA